jgi:hypothetical protein
MFSLSLSLSAIVLRSPLPPTCLVLMVKEARSYFASTIHHGDPVLLVGALLRNQSALTDIIHPLQGLYMEIHGNSDTQLKDIYGRFSILRVDRVYLD